MNLWQALLKNIKAKGYTGGDDDLGAVKAFCVEKKLAPTNQGKAIDIEKAHADAHPEADDLDISEDVQKAEIDAKAKELATKMLAERDELTGANKGKGGTGKAKEHDVTVGKDRIENDPNRGFKHFGEYALAVKSVNTAPDERLKYCLGTKAATGLQAAIGSDGGFLIPPTFSTTIIEGMQGASDNMLEGTQQFTVEGESFTFNGVAETSRATGSRWGGTRAYWLSEASQMTSSRPRFRQVKLEPQQLGVLIYATDKLMNNSPVAIGQLLSRSAVDEINFTLGDAIVNGTGAGQPLGLLNSGATVSVDKETGQAAATILAENILKMSARLHPSFRNGAEFLINVDTLPQLRQMSIAIGTGGALVFTPPNGLSGGAYGTLDGLPIRAVEYCPTLGTVGDIILWNRRAYLVGLRGDIQTAMSIHLRFDYNETAFRFVFEADGQPAYASALTPFKGSNTLSACVTLATRA